MSTSMLEYEFKFNNVLRDIMCSRCNKKVKEKCFRQNRSKRFDSLIVCLKIVMKPDDEKYPTEVPRV
jgi:hypothetical protein